MAKRNQKPGYLYGLILNQEKYPVKVHKAVKRNSWLEAKCGAGVTQSRVELTDRTNRILVQHRLLDGTATVFCARCYPDKKGKR